MVFTGSQLTQNFHALVSGLYAFAPAGTDKILHPLFNLLIRHHDHV
jgi:hypothetical protein